MAALACIVCEIPMIADLDRDPFTIIRNGDYLRLDGDKGTIEVYRK